MESSNVTLRKVSKGGLDGGADAVYFFMYSGWKSELRSNRWHYASRWSKHLPVILVQQDDERSDEGPVSVPEPRIPNCRILYVPSTKAPRHYIRKSLKQTLYLKQDLDAHGFSRPIFWMYDADYVLATICLPAAARIVHATENYFYFRGYPNQFYERIIAAIKASDLVIAVSDGVARSYVEHSTKDNVHVINNGCDYDFYSSCVEDQELQAAKRGFAKLVAYAGNVNERLDFNLILQCLKRYPDFLFVFFGPVNVTDLKSQVLWGKIQAQNNCRHLGGVAVERLPNIYATADLGIIPYVDEPIIVDNTFPLKALEMAATGLPVVSTKMEAIKNLAGGAFRVVNDSETFIEVVGELSRAAISERDKTYLSEISSQATYDDKFAEVLKLVDRVIASNGQPTVRMEGIFDDAFRDEWGIFLDESRFPKEIGDASALSELLLVFTVRIPRLKERFKRYLLAIIGFFCNRHGGL